MKSFRKLAVCISLVVGLGAASVACSSSGDSTAKSTDTAASTSDTTADTSATDTAAPTDTGATDTASDTAADTDATDTAASGGKDLSNPDIKAELSKSDPELWALVNYNYLSWSAFGGYNVILNVGADASKAVDLCNALSALVYDSEVYKPTPDTPIVIAVPESADDYTGKPAAERKDKADTCKAVS